MHLVLNQVYGVTTFVLPQNRTLSTSISGRAFRLTGIPRLLLPPPQGASPPLPQAPRHRGGDRMLILVHAA